MQALSVSAPVTKTEFVRSRDCIKKAWLGRHRPDLAAPLTISDRQRIETGRRIGELARQIYSDGVFGSNREDSPQASRERTIALMSSGTPVLFEARLEAEGCLAKVDILRKMPEGWAIEEVKSATSKPPDKVKDDHILDVSFQLAVAKAMHIQISAARVVAVDRDYTWDGSALDPAALLKTTDVTERCSNELPLVQREMAALAEVMSRQAEPLVETNTHCKDCSFHSYCHQDQPRFDVVFLPTIKAKQVTQLRSEGMSTIDRIPPGHEVLTPSRSRLHKAVISGKPIISDELGAALDKLRFPAAFIDYEIFSPAIPMYPQTKPYERFCFQWSAHLATSADSVPDHREFLAEGSQDPRAEFCESLWSTIKDCRSIVHYSDFEITQVKHMAEACIPYADELYSYLLANSFDLLRIVREHVCYAEFLGRTSIKVVLPVLVPTLSYETLEIADGNAAAAAFLRIASGETPNDEREQLRSALLAYCKQDTLAMVEIYRALVQIARDW